MAHRIICSWYIRCQHKLCISIVSRFSPKRQSVMEAFNQCTLQSGSTFSKEAGHNCGLLLSCIEQPGTGLFSSDWHHYRLYLFETQRLSRSFCHHHHRPLHTVVAGLWVAAPVHALQQLCTSLMLHVRIDLFTCVCASMFITSPSETG